MQIIALFLRYYDHAKRHTRRITHRITCFIKYGRTRDALERLLIRRTLRTLRFFAWLVRRRIARRRIGRFVHDMYKRRQLARQQLLTHGFSHQKTTDEEYEQLVACLENQDEAVKQVVQLTSQLRELRQFKEQISAAMFQKDEELNRTATAARKGMKTLARNIQSDPARIIKKLHTALSLITDPAARQPSASHDGEAHLEGNENIPRDYWDLIQYALTYRLREPVTPEFEMGLRQQLRENVSRYNNFALATHVSCLLYTSPSPRDRG